MNRKKLKERLKNHYIKYLGYDTSGDKKLLHGLTTGATAVACAKAGVLFLEKGYQKKYVSIDVEDKKPKVLIETYEKVEDGVIVSAYKYAGDDIDATDLMLISVLVKKNDCNSDIIIDGGVGIGTVTKRGLGLKVGYKAINKGPKSMIVNEIRTVSNKGYEVLISAPKGKEIAKRTFNENLGIMDGISIIGSTGLVRPMSIEALKETIKREIEVKKSPYLSFCIGRYSKTFLESLGIREEKIVTVSNFIGFSMEQAKHCKIESILLCGNLGKLIKVAGGIYNTHSHVADGKKDIMIANLALLGAPLELLYLINKSNTTSEMADYIKEYNLEKVYDVIGNKIEDNLEKYTKEKIKIQIILLGDDKEVIFKSDNTYNLINKIKYEK